MTDRSHGPTSLRGEQQTMLMSLYLHARDAASTHPVLGDRFAAQILDGVDHDAASLRRLRGNQPLVVGRAALIDRHVRTFLASNDAAVVLHLGCGLDSRVLRIDPAPDVTWIEVDQEPVIELRRRFYPERDGVTTIAASVTDPAWWPTVATNRPLLVLAEGLFMYLSAGEVDATCDMIAAHDSPTTMLLADTVAPWVRRVAGRQSSMRAASTGFRSTTADLARAMARQPRLLGESTESLVREAARVSSGALARLIGLLDHVQPGHRAMVLNHYRLAPA